MRGTVLRLLVWALLAGLAPIAAQAEGAQLVSVKTPRGVKQAFILMVPEKPVAAVILFAGGHGGLGLMSATDMHWGKGNFLVRTRAQFLAQGFIVAVADSPSDKPKGMNAVFRMTNAHADDIGAIVTHLKARANVPVWVVGTSMGTFSAAEGAIATKGVDGLVLSSTVTRSKPDWLIARSNPNGVASMPLSRVTVPTLLVAHRHDGCDLTPAKDVEKLKAALTKARPVDVAIMDGGDPPRSAPCEARAQHGFLGIEKQTVATIATFIKANSK